MRARKESCQRIVTDCSMNHPIAHCLPITVQLKHERSSLQAAGQHGYEAATDAYHVAEAAPQRCVGGK
jgi:DNA-directed RNA polymerase subunit L